MASWLAPDELRVGLGCMRLAEQAEETIAAAVDAGITVFDTARAYEGKEQLLARVLRAADGARIVTKGGMARPDGAWRPDGRAKTIRSDCEASLFALDGLPIDLYLLQRRIRARPGPRRFARCPGSSTRSWSRESASATSTVRNWTRPWTSRRSPLYRSGSARSTTGRSVVASSIAVPSSRSP